MSNSTKGQVAMLDTSFLIRLLKNDDPLHGPALDYYQYLLEHEYILFVSTIALAEYCVKGDMSEIPFDNLRVVPFNLDHSAVAGKFAASLYEAKKQGGFEPGNRLIIPNDTKIFAQAAKLNAVYVVTADSKSKNAMNVIAAKNPFTVQHLDIHESLSETFGILPFESCAE